MTLTDTGPIVGIIDADDKHHSACKSALPGLDTPMVTPWPCFTEAMYLLGESLGHSGQDDLWNLIDKGILVIHESSLAERSRMRELMAKYKDTPMDLADASLVAAAEVLGVRRIFTVDSDFVVYRLPGKLSFEIVP
ncbi:MAG: type II toxin-antitoxin system VapC family toxin [Janthinobacterium lividum]